ncbi:DUF4384 domain-containing protein [Holophaga foetida]|uniref:DUF4384 domain-containing protein n=1 Tax=Holophaga foetida TaxID=35839 RepID=UPI0002472141|nr:DUF4384 domain-containing protein [Holophaga foetida]
MSWKCLVLVPALIAPALSAQAPAWIQSPSAPFPSHTYLTGYGLSEARGSEAQRMKEAKAMARQELASTLRVRVQSEFTSATAHTRTEGTRYVQNLVQTRSDLDLEGLDRFETWTDPRSGAIHVLAVIERTRAASLLEERLQTQAREARSEFQRIKAHRDLDGLLKVRGLLKRTHEDAGLLRVLGKSAMPLDLPSQGELDSMALEVLKARPGLDGALDAALYTLGADLPGRLRVMIDRIVYGQTRFSSTFGAYLEQRLGERLLKFDGIQVLDRALAAREGSPLQSQALLHGTYIEMGDEVSLLLKATAMGGEELASSQIRLPKAWIQKAGLRLLPENHQEAAQSLAILDTQVRPSDLKINLQVDRGDGGIYRQGELLHLFLRSNRDCYVRVVYQQVDGSKVQVFPNQYHPDYRVKKDAITRIPAEGDLFELRISEPFGSEIVKVFASTEPFELAPAATAQEGPFARLDASVQAMTTRFRGIQVQKAKTLSAEASAVVNTVPTAASPKPLAR